jgi:hypothetical protein
MLFMYPLLSCTFGLVSRRWGTVLKSLVFSFCLTFFDDGLGSGILFSMGFSVIFYQFGIFGYKILSL